MYSMEFKKVITAILLELDKHNIPYALIGAVAMGFWGVQRDTAICQRQRLKAEG